MTNFLELLSGEDFKIADGIWVKNLTLREVIAMGVPNYLSNVRHLTLVPYDIADILWCENEIWYEDITPFELFCYGVQTAECAIEAMEALVRIDKGTELTEDIFNNIVSVLNVLHGVPPKDVPTSTTALFVKKKLVENMQRKRKLQEKIKSKNEIDFESIVSSVAWCSPNVNILNVWDLTTFQIHDGYKRLCLKDDYDKIMTGIYAGTVDAEKINREKIHWSRIITDQEFSNKEETHG